MDQIRRPFFFVRDAAITTRRRSTQRSQNLFFPVHAACEAFAADGGRCDHVPPRPNAVVRPPSKVHSDASVALQGDYRDHWPQSLPSCECRAGVYAAAWVAPPHARHDSHQRRAAIATVAYKHDALGGRVLSPLLASHGASSVRDPGRRHGTGRSAIRRKVPGRPAASDAGVVPAAFAGESQGMGDMAGARPESQERDSAVLGATQVHGCAEAECDTCLKGVGGTTCALHGSVVGKSEQNVASEPEGTWPSHTR
jgi:hypothetical protein